MAGLGVGRAKIDDRVWLGVEDGLWLEVEVVNHEHWRAVHVQHATMSVDALRHCSICLRRTKVVSSFFYASDSG